MVNKRKEHQSLAETISNVLHVAPATIDPEDNEDSTPKIVQKHFDTDSEEDVVQSKFRKHNVDLLEDVDKRYAGKTGSRKNFTDTDDEWETYNDSKGSNESDESRNSEVMEDSDQSQNSEAMEESDDNENSDFSSNQSESGEENGNSDYSESEDDETRLTDTEDSPVDDGFKEINKTVANTQVQKGICVRNQLNIWENLLEMRIQLQKCLIEANKMPQSDVFNELEKQSSEEFISKANDTGKNVEHLLQKLLELQSVLIKDGSKKGEYQEISQQIEEDNERRNDDDIDNTTSPCKRRKLNDYENKIKHNFEAYKPHRNSIIKKWDNNTRIPIIKNKGNPTYTVVNQIENILNNKQKLIKKSQLKLTKSKDESEDADHDPEIFDDNDFYHQLLKDLIDTKSSDITDPVKLGRQWIGLQNTRNKMKRGIDTRATKGRKIRYTVHSKLVNFMAPIDNNLYTGEARTELFNSLFGKNNYVKL